MYLNKKLNNVSLLSEKMIIKMFKFFGPTNATEETHRLIKTRTSKVKDIVLKLIRNEDENVDNVDGGSGSFLRSKRASDNVEGEEQEEEEGGVCF